MTARTLLTAAAVLGLALMASACAATKTTQAGDDLLLDCRAKADDQVKARYTAPWERAVQECLDKAGND